MNKSTNKLTNKPTSPYRVAPAVVSRRMSSVRMLLATLLVAIFAASQIGASCNAVSTATTITQAEAGIVDAQLVLTLVQTGVDGYFAAKPNASLQATIDGAMADAQAALRTVNTALAGATSLSDNNVQAAIASFSTAFDQLMALVAQIGVQVNKAAPRGVSTRTASGIAVAPPILFGWAATKK
jgi:hypothetical protein